jgi:hypothetical protein
MPAHYPFDQGAFIYVFVSPKKNMGHKEIIDFTIILNKPAPGLLSWFKFIHHRNLFKFDWLLK